MQSSQKGE